MSISTRNYVIYGYDLSSLDFINKKIQDMRESGHYPRKQNDITYLSDADCRHRVLGIILSVEADDGFFSMWPQEIKKTKQLKEAIAKVQRKFKVPLDIKPKVYVVSHFF